MEIPIGDNRLNSKTVVLPWRVSAGRRRESADLDSPVGDAAAVCGRKEPGRRTAVHDDCRGGDARGFGEGGVCGEARARESVDAFWR